MAGMTSDSFHTTSAGAGPRSTSASPFTGAGDEPDCKMAEAALHQERTMKALALSPAFTAPAEFSLDNHSPASALSELDGGLEFDGLGLGPELQYLLESHLAESPMHSDSHLLDEMDKVSIHARMSLGTRLSCDGFRNTI